MEPFLPDLDRRGFLELLATLAANSSLPKGQREKVRVPPQLASMLAAATPADFARIASHGKWYLAPHLALLNRKLLDLSARRIKRLIVTMPPRHGKSSLISRYFPAWYLGTHPDHSVIISSYSADLAARWSGLARQAAEEFLEEIFDVTVSQRRHAGDDWNLEGYDGCMKSAGVGGGITGRGGHLIVTDDLIKNSEEAHSLVYREKTWEFYNSTLYTRLEPDGVIINVLTRWHEDDYAGRLLDEMSKGGEQYELLNLPAIAEENEPPFPVSMGRKEGEALWPARFDEATLASIRRQISDPWWYALYQQRPTAKEGDIFKSGDWQILNGPAPSDIIMWVRFWDLASTAENTGRRDPDYASGTKIGFRFKANPLVPGEKEFFINHVRHFRLGPGETVDAVVQTAEIDGRTVPIYLEQEPGASSPNLINVFQRKLQGYSVRGVRPEGSKVIRAEAYSVDVRNHNVFLVNDPNEPWDIHGFIQEHKMFPSGAHDDRIDSSSGGHGALARMKTGGILGAASAAPPDPNKRLMEILDEGNRKEQERLRNGR